MVALTSFYRQVYAVLGAPLANGLLCSGAPAIVCCYIYVGGANKLDKCKLVPILLWIYVCLGAGVIPDAGEPRMGLSILLVHGDIQAIELVATGDLGYGIYVYTPIKVRFKGMNTSYHIFPDYQA